MLVSSLLQSFNNTPYLFYKKRFKSDINSFCIWTQFLLRAQHSMLNYLLKLIEENKDNIIVRIFNGCLGTRTVIHN
jgi:hypothetical protein